ncbi:DNA topoisomerase family protein [Avibacterium paragallinarum]|uniref:DNA topoisomerase family protein n=1 Tax=Avibacterium paragallinarum TaxID=728 RepID=UPI0021F72F50|nr:topoisomerase DNA-binding C4 zinc finger domain-containing protein [Avibacterium paragallinarum]UXN34859.1 topoisomerase DNA-binding C4 zinc finger domain-containing protein [Avibacterium paragallinarum]
MNKSLFQASKHTEHCPQCGAALQIKKGKKGLFLGCTAYPQCDFIKPLHPHSETKVLKTLEQACPQCGHFLQLKQGQYGMFIGCSHYPDCDYIVHEELEPEQEHLPCPACGKGKLVPRRGRQGKVFYGCDQFPKCKFTLASQPYAVPCPQCAYPISTLKKEEKTDRTLHRTWLCANKACHHQFETENE